MLSVLMPSLQELPGGMLSSYDVATNNKSKNRYGNIVTCKFVHLLFFRLFFSLHRSADFTSCSSIPAPKEKKRRPFTSRLENGLN